LAKGEVPALRTKKIKGVGISQPKGGKSQGRARIISDIGRRGEGGGRDVIFDSPSKWSNRSETREGVLS